MPPPVVAGSLAALNLVASSSVERARLHGNATDFRQLMTTEGFDLLPGCHPIVPVMFGDAWVTGQVATAMLDQGVLVKAFSYPVVPKGQARIRVQLSAAHSGNDVQECVQAFVRARSGVSDARRTAA